jgi:enolase-phosphatase E1
VAETLHAWMDADAKITPLKTLQGLIWEEGYRTGALVGDIYPDVPPVLRRWHAAGIALFVYSSGSRAAQLLIFGHSTAGDLRPLFSGFFDTGVGAKQAAGSYRAIAGATALTPEDFLFLSDNEAELDAAQAAGMAVLQLVRANDGTAPSCRHPTAPDFSAIAIG